MESHIITKKNNKMSTIEDVTVIKDNITLEDRDINCEHLVIKEEVTLHKYQFLYI